MLESVAQAYSDLFAPELFVLAATVALVGYEWRGDDDRRVGGLLGRLGVVAVAWVVAFAVYTSTPLFLGEPWRDDLLGGVGLAVGFLGIAAAWRRRDWGDRLPPLAALLVALTAVHTVVVPFWNVSGHVAYTTAPGGYLAWVDRRFAPFALVPVGMVAARPLAGAHTWAQAVAGFALASLLLVGLIVARRR
jgi:hypothetical protein